MTKRRLPVFPLSLVLLPRMPLPLHIFEERYRLLVSRCLREDMEFGIVLHTGSTVRKKGCIARIDNVITRYPDGRMDILTVGTDRFIVDAFFEDQPYLEAAIDLFHDENAGAGDLPSLASASIDALAEFAVQEGYEIDNELLSSLSFEELSFLLATTDVFSLEEKQLLLELTDTRKRLERTTAVLKESTSRRKMASQIKKIVGDEEDINHLFN